MTLRHAGRAKGPEPSTETEAADRFTGMQAERPGARCRSGLLRPGRRNVAAHTLIRPLTVQVHLTGGESLASSVRDRFVEGAFVSDGAACLGTAVGGPRRAGGR
ncbi:hypothetical protein GCM10010270_12590 [Streptomyces violaceus]|nr:hypothetical protein GCM10010270_12590 [Streptomyces janthinus]